MKQFKYNNNLNDFHTLTNTTIEFRQSDIRLPFSIPSIEASSSRSHIVTSQKKAAITQDANVPVSCYFRFNDCNSIDAPLNQPLFI